jgi:hypothetical protein
MTGDFSESPTNDGSYEDHHEYGHQLGDRARISEASEAHKLGDESEPGCKTAKNTDKLPGYSPSGLGRLWRNAY